MKSKKEVVLRVNNVSKDFFIPHHESGSVKESITQIFSKKERGGRTYHALKEINFEVEKGDFFGVVGRNGAGKSTLLKIMAQIYRPTSGDVTAKGKLVPFIELGVGFNNNLTGKQNVYLNGAILGFSKKEIDAMYEEIVEFAELAAFMDQKLKNYSSGMRVRLAFSIAIRADADILLLDEVLAVGDADFKKKCYSYFDLLKKNKKTIILVSHGMSAIREYCNKAILIENGRIAAQGSSEEVADEYNRLFNKPKDKTKKQAAETPQRWGTREVYIETFDLSVTPKFITIKTNLVSDNYETDHIKFGITILDGKGKIIAGLNNMNAENPQKLHFKPNEKKQLVFTLDNIYGNKTYSVSATLTEPSGGTIFDKWRDITNFTNTREEAFYPVVSPSTLELKSGEPSKTT